MNPFAFNPGNSTMWRYVEGDEVVFAPTQPGWKDGLRYLKRLHDEGLLDPESFSIDQNALRQLTENPDGNRVGMSLGGYHGMFAALDADCAKNDYEALPPLEGPPPAASRRCTTSESRRSWWSPRTASIRKSPTAGAT